MSDVTVANGVSRATRTRLPSPVTLGLGLVVVLVVPFALTTTRFLTVANGRAILASAAFVGIAAVGATFVMVAGSAVSMAVSQSVTLLAVVFLHSQDHGLLLAIPLTVVVGALVTALQGLAIGYWDANPIVLTIAAGFAIGGGYLWISGGVPVYGKVAHYDVLNRTPMGLPVAVYVFVVLTLVAQFVMHRTVIGRQMYLVGENREAARSAGIPVGRVIALAWAVSGACIALATVFIASFQTVGTPQLGGTMTLDVIAAVLVGGTAITGGRGSALRTFGGATLIAVVADILLIRGYSVGVQILAKGLLVLFVVAAVHLSARRSAR